MWGTLSSASGTLSSASGTLSSASGTLSSASGTLSLASGIFSSESVNLVLSVRNLVLSVRNLVLSVRNLVLSVRNLVLSVRNLVLSVRNLVLSVRNLVLSVRNLVLSVRNLVLSVRNLVLSVRNLFLRIRNLVLSLRNLVLSVRNASSAKGLRSFYSCAIEWDHVNLIIAYRVYYDYYKIFRNKQSKITVQQTDLFTEHFYQQWRLTAEEQITVSRHYNQAFHISREQILTIHGSRKYPFPPSWNSIEHKVRNSIILTFTSFSITHAAGKTCFYVHGLSSYARMRHQQKAYGPYNPKIQSSDRRKFKFLLQGPWNSIEHKVRNSIILTITSFSITHAAGKTCFLCPRTPSDARISHRQKAYWQ